MKKLLSLICIGLVLAPSSLLAASYHLTVTVCNGADCGDVTPPSTPTNLVVTSVTTSQINLAWDASIDPGSPASGVLGYSIYRNGGVNPVATTTGISYSDTGLNSGTTYSYTVLAYDGAYNESGQSTAVSTTTISIPSNAPNASNGSPTGSLAAGTTQTTLSLDTDINATCRYGTTANTSYASLPNTFSSTGGLTHSTVVTGLANGITRTFYVRCESDTHVPMTTDYIISFSVSSPASSGGGGGGGGGGGPATLPTNPVNVIVRGVAYPGSRVNLLKDGQLSASTQSGPDARFEIQLSGVGEGTFTFSVWASDKNGVRSTLYPFTVTLTKGATTVISGVFIPPTVSIDYETVRRGDPLRVIGQSAPAATVSVIFHSDNEIIENVVSDAQGLWTYALDTLRLDYGDHTTQARSKKENDISTLSKTIAFKVGTVNVAAKKEMVGGASRADFNADGRIDLADFSIMLYWYKRTLTAKAPPVDLNNDGKVDLVDFSIFAFNWTG
jgi:hypothetical protein